MSEATIEGKVRKAVVKKSSDNKSAKGYLYIEVDENGIEQNTSKDKYYKPLLVENSNTFCAQEVKKDEDYYYVEICVPSWLISILSIPSVIRKKMKIKFECASTPETQIKEDKIIECEIYE